VTDHVTAALSIPLVADDRHLAEVAGDQDLLGENRLAKLKRLCRPAAVAAGDGLVGWQNVDQPQTRTLPTVTLQRAA